MNKEIMKHVASLRDVMSGKSLSAFVVPSADPHISEYVADHWKVRAWVSGFTGSAGTFALTSADAGLWTDSRYFLQAGQQLEGTGIELYKEMLPETPSIAEFLKSRLKEGDVVGVDGRMFSVDRYESLRGELTLSGIVLQCCDDVIDCAWTDRPSLPLSSPFIHEMKYAGETAQSKIAKLRESMRSVSVESMLISALDEVAWVLNMRGDDVECNPVFISYLLLTLDGAKLFIDPRKLTPELTAYLQSVGVECEPYDNINRCLSELTVSSLQLEVGKTNYSVYSALPAGCRVVRATSPVAMLKAVRNDVEIAGMRAAMLRDGVALVRLLRWIDENVASGELTEVGVSDKLDALRAESELYRGVSFGTIAGYAEHGAIVHYEADEASDVALQPKSFLLLDVGAQYLDGTTDVTRTIPLGELTDGERLDYTLILKGHIDLAMAVFPEGTRGAQLDVLARMPIWQHHMNYLHGTGHGVGHFLNVHEGPQSIRMNENPVPLVAGMLTSNEPGLYKAGKHGIRTESLVLTRVAGDGMFGRYLEFETVTLCPIATSCIMPGVLTGVEVEWLNSYNERVCKSLSPLLASDDRVWLERATEPIHI
jgi:Xaa-Pro aminopeptidase